jgi:thioesterase domain-containing protein
MAQWIDDFHTYRVNYQDRYYTALNSSQGAGVFALPPLLGYAAAFRGLAALLPSNPVVGFDFVDGAGLLDRYAAAIASLQPTGNVSLFGYSGGGNLGFELAKKLESAGRTVTLILLDSFRLDATQEQSEAQIQRAIKLNLDYFDRYMEADPELRVFVSSETVRAILIKKMGGYLKYLDTIDNRGSIRGDIHLIESTEFAGDPRRSAWAGATEGTFRTYQGHGAHVEMMLESHVVRNAEILHRILNARAD